ncbi:MAG: hypothetical protein ACRCZF_23765, partial [Gemmataceae bacterium]
PNPRPDVVDAEFDNGVAVRGSYLRVSGSGFLGASSVSIGGTPHAPTREFFRTDSQSYASVPTGGLDGGIDRAKMNYGEFAIIDDNTILVKTAVIGGLFAGAAAFDAEVTVVGPDGTPEQTSLTSKLVSFGQTVPLTFTTVGFTPSGVSPVPGFPQYNGNPVIATWGSRVSIQAKTGTFFGVSEVLLGDRSPIFEVSDDGSTITALVDGGLFIPDPPPPPPNVPAFTPQRPVTPQVTLFNPNGKAVVSSDGGASVQVVRTTEGPRIDPPPPLQFINRRVTFFGANLLGLQSISFAAVDEFGNQTNITIPRTEMQLNDVTGGSVSVIIPVGAFKGADDLYDRRIFSWVSGQVTASLQKGTASGTFTHVPQPVPDLITFLPKNVATIDNRVFGNSIYENGSSSAATARTNGQFGIDFVTDYGQFRQPSSQWINIPLVTQGNEARGGMDERQNGNQIYNSFPQTTFPNDFPGDQDVANLRGLNPNSTNGGVIIGLPGNQ